MVVLLTLPFVARACARDLRVCADPDNLPFSNLKQQGFENRIAELVARDLHARLVYQWQRVGRGFFREYLNPGKCDLLVGVPAQLRPVLTTTPYYRSSYMFVTRRDKNLRITSFDDPQLRGLKIGVQALDEDYAPPGMALARRGLENQIVGFDTTGADADSIIRAVAQGRVDLAIAWGPLAGYYARRFPNALHLQAVMPQIDPPNLPLTFAIAMGVRKGNTGLRDELESVLQRRRSQLHEILARYGVPQMDAGDGN
jgi:mxaJ protein